MIVIGDAAHAAAPNAGHGHTGPIKRIIRDMAISKRLKSGPRNTAAWLTRHHIDWDAPCTSQGSPVAGSSCATRDGPQADGDADLQL